MATPLSLVLADGGTFALYFELLWHVAGLCLVFGLFMVPVYAFGLLPEPWRAVKTAAGGACSSEEGEGAVVCRPLEVSALLNAAVLGAVIVVLPGVRSRLRQLAPLGIEESGALLLEHVPQDATEEEVEQFLCGQLELARAAYGSPDGVATATQPLVLLAPRDPRLPELLKRYLECLRDAAGEARGHADAEAGEDDLRPTVLGAPRRARDGLRFVGEELRRAEFDLQRPRARFGDGDWDFSTAPVGIALTATPSDARLLAEQLGPATLAAGMKQCCCRRASSAEDETLRQRLRHVTARYPAPEPGDVVWKHLGLIKGHQACRRRFACTLIILAYLAVEFGALVAIRRYLGNPLVMGIVTALCTLSMQELVRQTLWAVGLPCARTHHHCLVAMVTMAGCLISGFCVPLFIFSLELRSGRSWYDVWYGQNGLAGFFFNALVTNATLATVMDVVIDNTMEWLATHLVWRPDLLCGRPLLPWKPEHKTFRKLCKVYEGPEFYLGPNLGFSMNTVLLAVMLSTVQPFAPLIACAGLLGWFAKEKWLLLMFCHRPRLLSPRVAIHGPEVLACGLVFVPAASMLGLLPFCPPKFCSRRWWFIGICREWMDPHHTLVVMSLEACVFAAAAVHGGFLMRVLARRLACCSCACCRRRRCCRSCCRGFGRVLAAGSMVLRVLSWLALSTFLWLTAYWRGGVGLGEKIDLPLGIGSIALFTDSVRTTFLVIYEIALLTLVVAGILGLLCRVLSGPVYEVPQSEDAPESLSLRRAPMGEVEMAEVRRIAYAKASPFHASELLGQDGGAEMNPRRQLERRLREMAAAARDP